MLWYLSSLSARNTVGMELAQFTKGLGNETLTKDLTSTHNTSQMGQLYHNLKRGFCLKVIFRGQWSGQLKS